MSARIRTRQITLVRIFLFVLMSYALAQVARSAEPPSAPILRIETAMHSAPVRRIRIDSANRRLITASDDKTIRIWDLPGTRLPRILRYPIGAGHEGRITGLALTPDGRSIAAGGWTGWDWDHKASIYLFDYESGELKARLGEFAETIADLTFSADGRYLAVGLTANGGLHVLRTSDYKEVAADLQYADKCTGLQFYADGRLATAALDGFLRLYDASFNLIARKQMAGGKKPSLVQLSPDGSKLAVSFEDAKDIEIRSARDLSPMYSAALVGAPGDVRMTHTTWSSDGTHLFGVPQQEGAAQSSIYRWADAGRGSAHRFYSAERAITDIRPSP